MFRVVTIHDILDGTFNEDSFVVEEAFFFTIKSSPYYVIYNKMAEIIGMVPSDYNLFFKVDHHGGFEDIDMENVIRLFQAGEKFKLVGTKSNSNKVTLIDSEDIARFHLVEDDYINIPFTNKAFDCEGIVIFKNMASLADSLNIEDIY